MPRSSISASLDSGILFRFRSLLLWGGRFQMPSSRSKSGHSSPRTSPRLAPVKISNLIALAAFWLVIFFNAAKTRSYSSAVRYFSRECSVFRRKPSAGFRVIHSHSMERLSAFLSTSRTRFARVSGTGKRPRAAIAASKRATAALSRAAPSPIQLAEMGAVSDHIETNSHYVRGICSKSSKTVFKYGASRGCEHLATRPLCGCAAKAAASPRHRVNSETVRF